jgi:hypothetical protein
VVELDGEGFEKSARVLGETGGVKSIALWLDGERLKAPRVVYGDGRDWSGGAIDEGDLAAEHSPSQCRAVGSVLCLWRPRSPAADRGEIAPDLDRETRERLEALGYLGAEIDE